MGQKRISQLIKLYTHPLTIYSMLETVHAQHLLQDASVAEIFSTLVAQAVYILESNREHALALETNNPLVVL